MNRRNFLATIAGAMAYAGLRMNSPKAPEIALKTRNAKTEALLLELKNK